MKDILDPGSVQNREVGGGSREVEGKWNRDIGHSLCFHSRTPLQNQNFHFQSSTIKDWLDQFVSRSDKQMQCLCTKRSQSLTDVTEKKARSRRDLKKN